MSNAHKIVVVSSVLLFTTVGLMAQELPAFQRKQINSQALHEIYLRETARDYAERLAINKAVQEGKIIPFVQLSESSESQIQSISGSVPLFFMTDNVNAAASIGANKLHTNGGLGLNLNGQGIVIGEWDGGATLTSHQEFGNRVSQFDNAQSLSNHATHVAGTIVASGVQASAKGMAPQAILKAYDWSNDNGEMTDAAAQGLILSNHSYGLVSGWAFGGWATGGGAWHWFGDPLLSQTQDYKFGYYDYGSSVWDQIANNAPHYLIVKSAGNDRGESYSGGHYVWQNGGWSFSTTSRNADGNSAGYDCISGSGNSKNILTVGAVDDVLNYQGPSSVVMSSFSGWGPTDDGRIKPDIVANGVGLYSSLATSSNAYASYSGTSMSGPSATGGLGLVQQHYFGLHNQYMLASTLKGLAIHSAKESGTSPGPDYAFGWGLLDVERAVQILNDTNAVIIEDDLINNAVKSYTITLGTSPARMTLVWNDPAATPVTSNVLNNSTPRLVNDLDIRLTSPSGTVYYPFKLNPAVPTAAATTGDNVVDNVEMIDLYNGVPAGNYVITIAHKGNLQQGAQTFSLIISGNGPTAPPVPGCSQDSIVAQPQDVMVAASTQSVSFTCQHSSTSALFQWQQKSTGISSWASIPGSTNSVLVLQNPNALVGTRVRCIVSYGVNCTSTSREAVISAQPAPIVSCNSTDTVLVLPSILCEPDSVQILVQNPKFDTLANTVLSNASIRNGNVVWMPFNNSTLDLSSFSNHGITQSASYSSNRANVTNSAKALSNAFVSIPASQSINSLSLPGSEGYSMSLWLKPDSLNEGVVMFRIDTTTDGSMLAFTSSNLFHYVTFLQDKISMVSTPLQNNQWQNITITQGPFLSIFWNGTLVDTANINGCMCSNSTLPIVLGIPLIDTSLFPTALPFGFGGQIDDFGLWNRTLTTNDVQSLVQEPAVLLSGKYAYIWNQDQDTSYSNKVYIERDTVIPYKVLELKTGNLCQSSVDVQVIKPVINASKQLVCISGDSVLLWVDNQTNSNTFTWSNGVINDSLWLTITQTTTISVVNNVNQVSCSDSVTITLAPALPASISGSMTSTATQLSYTLTAMPQNMSYMWSNSAMTASISIYPDSTTAYSVTVTDLNGCESQASYVVSTVPMSFEATLLNQVVNSAKGVHIAGNFQGWLANSSEMTFDASTGTYKFEREFIPGDTIYYKIINGDSWSDPHDFILGSCGIGQYGDRWAIVPSLGGSVGPFHLSSCNQNPPVNPLVLNINKCQSDSLFLDASGFNLTDFTWSTGDTTSSILAMNSGTYWLSAKYPSGVLIYDTIQIMVHPEPQKNVTNIGGQALCPGETVTLIVDTTHVTSLVWMPTMATSGSITTSIGGNYFAQFTTDSGCVVYSDTLLITNLSAPSKTLTISDSTHFCLGDTAVIYAEVGHIYQWNTGQTDSLITVATSGDFWVDITGANGCMTTSDTITTVMLPGVVLPVLFSSFSYVPANDTTNIKMIPYDSTYSYQWIATGGSIVGGQGGEEVDVHWTGSPGDTVFIMLIVDNGLCIDSTKLELTISGIGFDEGMKTILQLFPNPTNGLISLQSLGVQIEEPQSIRVYNALGELLYHVEHKVPVNLDLNTLSSGTYVMVISGEIGIQYLRFIKL